LPEGFEPVVKLNVGGFKSRYGMVKKPVLSIIGKVPIEAESGPDDEIPF
jgi:hypothetical protein